MLRALVLLSLLAPFAMGHAVPADFAALPYAAPLPFEGEASTLVTFDYRCSGMSTAESEANMSVEFDIVSAPEWARLRLEPERIELPTCRGVGQARAQLFGAADRNASELAPAVAIVASSWSTSGFVLNSTAQVPLEPTFVPGFDMAIAEDEKWEKPQSVVVFPVTFTSRATGPVKLVFEVVDKAGDLVAVLPQPVTLQGPGGAMRTADVPFTIQTPYHNGRLDEEGKVTYRATPQHPLDATKTGDAQEFTFTVHTKGFYMPGPQLLGAMLALAAAALVLKRRRR